MLERLLENGNRALESMPKDFQVGKGGTKVLSAEEARSWSGDAADPESDHHSQDIDREEDVGENFLTPFRFASRSSITSEEEVEVMTLAPDTTPPNLPHLVLSS